MVTSRFKCIVFASLFGCAGLSAADQPVSLTAVLATAKENNPDIRAARQAWQVRRLEVGPAGTWANPTFTFEDEEFPSGANTPPEKIRHYRVEQQIPFPGKLTVDARMRHHEALIAEADFHVKELEILGAVRLAFYRLYLADQKIALSQTSVATLKSVLQTAQSRLASGQSSTADVFMAQMELRKSENMLFQDQQERVLAQIELDSLLNQPTETAWGAAAAPPLLDIPASVLDLQAVARLTAPQYWTAQHEQNHARAMSARSRLEFAPDFNLMYDREIPADSPNGRTYGLGLSVPLWIRRPLGLARSSQEHVAEAEAISEKMETMVMKMVHMEFTETITHLTLARNYERDILPTAQSNLRVTREQYASGRGDFLRMLEAVRSWTQANNEYQEQLYHYGEHWSLLERWVGTDLSEAKRILAGRTNKENSHAR